MKRLMDAFGKIISGFCIGMLALMCVAMTYQVLARYIFGVSAAWSEETARFACVWLVYAGSCLCCFDDGHIRVTIVDSLIGKSLNYPYKVFRNLLSMAFFFVIAVIGFKLLGPVSGQISPNMRIPMNYVYSIIPIGCSLSILYLILDCVPVKKEVNGGND